MNNPFARPLGIMLAVLGGVLLWRAMFGRKSNLQKYYEVEGSLQNNGTIVNASSEAALDDYPLTTIGDTPFAGVHIDPFMYFSPAAQPKQMDWMQSIVNAFRPNPDLGAGFSDPNADKQRN